MLCLYLTSLIAEKCSDCLISKKRGHILYVEHENFALRNFLLEFQIFHTFQIQVTKKNWDCLKIGLFLPTVKRVFE